MRQNVSLRTNAWALLVTSACLACSHAPRPQASAGAATSAGPAATSRGAARAPADEVDAGLTTTLRWIAGRLCRDAKAGVVCLSGLGPLDDARAVSDAGTDDRRSAYRARPFARRFDSEQAVSAFGDVRWTGLAFAHADGMATLGMFDEHCRRKGSALVCEVSSCVPETKPCRPTTRAVDGMNGGEDPTLVMPLTTCARKAGRLHCSAGRANATCVMRPGGLACGREGHASTPIASYVARPLQEVPGIEGVTHIVPSATTPYVMNIDGVWSTSDFEPVVCVETLAGQIACAQRKDEGSPKGGADWAARPLTHSPGRLIAGADRGFVLDGSGKLATFTVKLDFTDPSAAFATEPVTLPGPAVRVHVVPLAIPAIPGVSQMNCAELTDGRLYCDEGNREHDATYAMHLVTM